MLDLETFQVALEQLTQAIYSHQQWQKELLRTLVCRLPCDQRDMAADAHHHCRFGQWYYSTGSQLLRHYPAFMAIELEHAHAHELAAHLLRGSENDGSLAQGDYDNFANSVDRLHLQLYSLKREIEDSIFRRDPLTGAENRIDMLTHLRQMLEMVKRRLQQCAIALMDLDHFKQINDNYGHLIGDQVLKSSVEFIRTHMRHYEKVFRYGGEEFLISMPNTDTERALGAIERIREGLSSTVLAKDGINPIFATASFGISSLDSAVPVETSIDRVDKALYEAKHAGRNQVKIWVPALAP